MSVETERDVGVDGWCARAAGGFSPWPLVSPQGLISPPVSPCLPSSMGGFAARKALKVVSHVEYVVAIELLCACAAIDMLRPLKTTPALEAVWTLVRSIVKPYDKDRFMAPDIEQAAQLVREGRVWTAVEQFIQPAYHQLPSMHSHPGPAQPGHTHAVVTPPATAHAQAVRADSPADGPEAQAQAHGETPAAATAGHSHSHGDHAYGGHSHTH